MRLRAATILLLLSMTALSAGCGSSTSSGSGSGSGTSTSTSTKAATNDSAPPAAPAANGALGPEGMPLQNGPALASASTTAPGTAVDGVQCAPAEQIAYHIHSHLQVYVEGKPRSIPGGIGMVGAVAQQTPAGPFYAATGCYYWLHTHTSDGVIHIESPTLRLYTLGQFFDEWGQPLNIHQVAGAKGDVTAFLNGRPWSKTPRDIPLLPHGAIQLDVGSPRVPFGTVSWSGTNL